MKNLIEISFLDDNETQQAFELHFNRELEIYQSICVINLVEQSGKEKIVGDKYADHIVRYNNEKIIYVTFDFHDYCRGMRFENVNSLIEGIAPELGQMAFHWRDSNGPICNQKSVFRTNCMDCLDRTNVVQTAIGKAVLESQLGTHCFLHNEIQFKLQNCVCSKTWTSATLRPTARGAEVAVHGAVGEQWGHYQQAVCWDECPERRLHKDWVTEDLWHHEGRHELGESVSKTLNV